MIYMHAHIPNRKSPLLADSWLAPFAECIRARRLRAVAMAERLTEGEQSLADFASGHEYFGLHRRADGGWVFREWAPNASRISLFGDFCQWDVHKGVECKPVGGGCWQCALPPGLLRHGQRYRLRLEWPGGGGDRIPTYARRVLQDSVTDVFDAQVWAPDDPYPWQHPNPPKPETPLVYECHVGMAQEEPRVGSYREFRDNMLPRIAESGYNTVQLMGIMEHPYYGSFGYHVSSFFAAASRFGTPEDFKALVDEAHRLGLRVIIDLIHSHAVRNEVEGLGRFDGTRHQFFHEGPRGVHAAWDSYCFDYAKPEVLHFLLSNCRFWLDEYRIDGFRFDGITSMVYLDHGLGRPFTEYAQYFDDNVDEDAICYLTLANEVIHSVRSDAVTVAEDVSGIPGLAAHLDEGGCGFDFRLAMGITDYWFKLMDRRDEDWSMEGLWYELTNRRADEQTISYVECHDQAIVGGQTMIYRLLGDAMYDAMHRGSESMIADRGVAIHKMARLATLATAGAGYLNFMGNEFGHPEWIDFPREGNNWSYHHARRLWSLLTDDHLRYSRLAEFDRAMLALERQYRIIENAGPVRIEINDRDKVIAFERGGLFIFLNFHPANSYADRPFQVLPGEYDLILDSDSPAFDGHGRLEPNQTYVARTEGQGVEARTLIRLYLPNRSGLVLSRVSEATP